MSCLSRLASIDGGLMEACFFHFPLWSFYVGFPAKSRGWTQGNLIRFSSFPILKLQNNSTTNFIIIKNEKHMKGAEQCCHFILVGGSVHSASIGIHRLSKRCRELWFLLHQISAAIMTKQADINAYIHMIKLIVVGLCICMLSILIFSSRTRKTMLSMHINKTTK